MQRRPFLVRGASLGRERGGLLGEGHAQQASPGGGDQQHAEGGVDGRIGHVGQALLGRPLEHMLHQRWMGKSDDERATIDRLEE